MDKLLLGLQMVKTNGRRISFICSLGHYFALNLAMIPLVSGLIMILFTDRKLPLHDVLYGTLVVNKNVFTEWWTQ